MAKRVRASDSPEVGLPLTTTQAEGAAESAFAGVAEIAASRERVRSHLHGRERTVTVVLAAAFVGAAAACAALVSTPTSFSPWVAALALTLYAPLSQVEFEIGPGTVVPTELMLVPMLFVLPPEWVPLLVAVGLVLGGVLERVRSRRHEGRLTVLLCSAWHSVGPALVIGLFAPGPPEWSAVPVYAAALAAQFAFDAVAVVVRQVIGRGIPALSLVEPLALVAAVDLSLAPVALVVAFAALTEPLAMVCVLPLAGLFHVLGKERQRRIDDNIELGRAVQDAARVARSDPLTGVGNRLAWQEAVTAAAERYERDATGASFLLVDLNSLKETNDTFGHDMGDRLIQALAVALRAAIPLDAKLARIGGDEFAVLASGRDERYCGAIVAAVRDALSKLAVGGVPVRASLGAASCPPCSTFDEALRLADERLYAEKTATTVPDP
jgi:diguanylate cyclase (GGDEF)-like protein